MFGGLRTWWMQWLLCRWIAHIHHCDEQRLLARTKYWLSWWWSACLHTRLLRWLSTGCLLGRTTGTKRGWRDRWPDGDITVGTSRGWVDGLLLWQCCSVDCTLDECSGCIEVDSALPSLRWTTVAGLDELLAVVMVICVFAYWAVRWLSTCCLLRRTIGAKRGWRDGNNTFGRLTGCADGLLLRDCSVGYTLGEFDDCCVGWQLISITETKRPEPLPSFCYSSQTK